MTFIHVPIVINMPQTAFLANIATEWKQYRLDSNINHTNTISIFNCNEYALRLCVCIANIKKDEQYNNLHASISKIDNKLQIRMKQAWINNETSSEYNLGRYVINLNLSLIGNGEILLNIDIIL